ncbi:hypothetical protein Dimus_002818 [Dionaea muscipula]
MGQGCGSPTLMTDCQASSNYIMAQQRGLLAHVQCANEIWNFEVYSRLVRPRNRGHFYLIDDNLNSELFAFWQKFGVLNFIEYVYVLLSACVYNLGKDLSMSRSPKAMIIREGGESKNVILFAEQSEGGRWRPLASICLQEQATPSTTPQARPRRRPAQPDDDLPSPAMAAAARCSPPLTKPCPSTMETKPCLATMELMVVDDDEDGRCLCYPHSSPSLDGDGGNVKEKEMVVGDGASDSVAWWSASVVAVWWSAAAAWWSPGDRQRQQRVEEEDEQ